MGEFHTFNNFFLLHTAEWFLFYSSSDNTKICLYSFFLFYTEMTFIVESTEPVIWAWFHDFLKKQTQKLKEWQEWKNKSNTCQKYPGSKVFCLCELHLEKQNSPINPWVREFRYLSLGEQKIFLCV